MSTRTNLKVRYPTSATSVRAPVRERWLDPVPLALHAEDSLEQPGVTAIKEQIADAVVAQPLRKGTVGAGDALWCAPSQFADSQIDRVLEVMRNRFCAT